MSSTHAGTRRLALFCLVAVMQSSHAVSGTDIATVLDVGDIDTLYAIAERPDGGHVLAADSSISWSLSTRWETLFEDDFQDADIWNWYTPDPEPDSPLPGGWELFEENGEFMLRGRGHAWAYPATSGGWTRYDTSLRLKLDEGTIHLCVRYSGSGRYFVGLSENHVYLEKEAPWGTFRDLGDADLAFALGQWHDVEIRVDGGNIDIYVDTAQVLSGLDPDPLEVGWIAVETLGVDDPDDGWTSDAYVDDVRVDGDASCFETGFVVAVTNPDGRPAWAKLYDIPGLRLSAADVTPTLDGGYYVAGLSTPTCITDDDAFVTKIDGSTGNPEWARRIGVQGTAEFADSVVCTPDGGCLVAITGGYPIASSPPTYSEGYYDIILVRLDADGNMQWQKAFGSGGQDYGGLMALRDGNYLVYGTTPWPGEGSWSALALKVGPGGDALWQAVLGGPGLDQFVAAAEASEGAVILGGHTQVTDPEPASPLLFAKLNAGGSLLWQRAYGAADSGYFLRSACRTVQGGGGDTAFAGQRWQDASGSWRDPVWLRVSDTGALQASTMMQRPVGYSDWDFVSGVTTSEDDVLVWAGPVVGNAQGIVRGKDMMLVSVDESLQSPHCPLFEAVDIPEVVISLAATDESSLTAYDPELPVTPEETNMVVSWVSINGDPLDCRAHGDFDGDGDVDLDDYPLFQVCLSMSGPAVEPAFSDCTDVFDFDGDFDVDLMDFARFEAVLADW